jgi:hypothetical protein
MASRVADAPAAAAVTRELRALLAARGATSEEDLALFQKGLALALSQLLGPGGLDRAAAHRAAALALDAALRAFDRTKERLRLEAELVQQLTTPAGTAAGLATAAQAPPPLPTLPPPPQQQQKQPPPQQQTTATQAAAAGLEAWLAAQGATATAFLQPRQATAGGGSDATEVQSVQLQALLGALSSRIDAQRPDANKPQE